MSRSRPILLGWILSLVAAMPIAADELVRLDDPDPYDLKIIGFELPRDAEVRVEAVGIRPPHSDDLAVYAWILDTETREPVWKMTRRQTDRVKGSRLLREAGDEIMLPRGRYELHLFAGEFWGYWFGVRKVQWPRWLDMFRSKEDDDDEDDDWDRGDYGEELARCYVALSSDDVSEDDVKRFKVTGGMDDALVRMNMLGDSRLVSQGIELQRPMSLRIYALIEYPKGYDGPADYAWIADAETREVVWRTRKRNTEHAGGGDKNRRFDDEVALDKGKYVLYYGTDDSHSWEEFNVNPPFDPVNWGVTVLPGSDFDRSAFKTFEVGDRGDPLLAFTRARDSDLFEQPFRFERDGELHVYAVGEYDQWNHEFADYAWIENAKTGGTEWEMTRRNTLPAGGADKNRMFDGHVTLEAGDYILYYVTDDSHSYDDWNASPPFDPEAWGVAVYETDSVKKKDVERLSMGDVEGNGDYLVRLNRARDHERLRQRFVLDKSARVHIHAVGEGISGRMYDYGYIIDDTTGRAVWEMEYRDTDHAGGARKNRLFDDEIRLEAGEYEAVFVTDGSHSFEGWNDKRPQEPKSWGMTIRRVK